MATRLWITVLTLVAGALVTMLLNYVGAPRWTFDVIGLLSGPAVYCLLKEHE